ncbi:28S ribosomal protein S18c, mitochondrial [Sitophilus oryzae]|uniref:28S ribosomal protein S18c, mitochondrial n=1 Tax=Sitophilus oryzae TaxID=7048 RepID=A0A6J2YIN0_SITOR|nr:28S ribosomal protein S18c, mitochondrial [Sitophilus oryzae]
MNFLPIRRLFVAAEQILVRSYGSKTVQNVSSNEPDFDMENPFEKEQHKCILCKHNITVDYKNVKLLSQFQSPYTGRIYGSHITGLCKKQQTIVEAEIIKAQSAGLMATYLKETCYLDDPKLFDVENPIRPHKY